VAKQNTRSTYQDGGSIFGMSDFGAPVARRLSVFSDAENVFSEGMGFLGADAGNVYGDALRYMDSYDKMLVNIARIASESARADLAAQIGSAKEAGTRILGWLISGGSPAYYATEVRSYLMDAQAPPYSAANPNFLPFTKTRAVNRVEGLKKAVGSLEPKVAEAMKIHGILAPDKTAELQKQLDDLKRQIAAAQAKEGGPAGTPAPTVTTPAGAVIKTTPPEAGMPGWVLPVAIGGLVVVGIGAYLLMQKR